VAPNLPLLQAALRQAGPWKDQPLEINRQWVIDRLMEKIAAIDWKAAAADVARFLGPAERDSLALWSKRFFAARVEQLPTSE
jgi:hypothetical protein